MHFGTDALTGCIYFAVSNRNQCVLFQQTVIFQCGSQCFQVLFFHVAQRQAAGTYFVTHQIQSCFYRDGIYFAEQRIDRSIASSCSFAAPATSPAMNFATMSWVFLGATLDSTEITPFAPSASIGTIWSSLPL